MAVIGKAHDAVAIARVRRELPAGAAAVLGRPGSSWVVLGRLRSPQRSRSRAFILVCAMFDYNDAIPSDPDIVTALEDSRRKPIP